MVSWSAEGFPCIGMHEELERESRRGLGGRSDYPGAETAHLVVDGWTVTERKSESLLIQCASNLDISVVGEKSRFHQLPTVNGIFPTVIGVIA
jgi:hypothetical protein